MSVCMYCQSQVLKKCLHVVCIQRIATFTELFYRIGPFSNKTKKDMCGFSGWIHYDPHLYSAAHACQTTHPPVIILVQPECNLKTTDTLQNNRTVSVSSRTGHNDFVIYYLATTMILLMFLHRGIISESNRPMQGPLRK